jgi:uncharacterized alpha-E superfamily protein
MLCRTANDLYWMGRHIERVDNTARLIDYTQRVALLPERLERDRAGAAAWARALTALELDVDYARRYGTVDAERVVAYLTLDADNPSSILACLRAARESGRSQRGSITEEMYEDINTAWIGIRDRGAAALANEGLTELVDWVKRRAGSFRGVTVGTMGRGDGYDFLRLGTFVERADYTACLIGIPFAPRAHDEPDEARNAVEYYQLSALLKAISAFETYRRIYQDTLTPMRVAELTILRAEMPRSLAACAGAVHDTLRRLSVRPGSEAVRQSGALAAELRYGRLDELVVRGVPVWLAGFRQRVVRLTGAIVDEFIQPADVIAA